MNIAVITSQDCPAGQNVKQQLLRLYNFTVTGLHDNHDFYELKVAEHTVRLYTIKKLHIYAENVDKEVEADIFIFATTHRSSAGVKSLTVHAPGNWGKAEMGGKDGELCTAAATMIKQGLKELTTMVRDKNLDFDVIQEATHHGPYIEKPCMFIEIGSSEKDYQNEEAGKIIAATIMEIINSQNNIKTAVGIGGVHHTPNFKDIQVSSEVAIGHVCPKYMLAELNAERLAQAIEKTWPSKAELVVVDWKGLGEHKARILKLLEENGVEWKKAKEIKRGL